MFRKLPEAIEQWSMENVAICAARQKEILDNAAVMLKPGGMIVYSTCTFSKEENEDVIEYFWRDIPILHLKKWSASGRIRWTERDILWQSL